MNIRTRLTMQFSLLVSGVLLLTFLMIYYLRINYTEEYFYDRLEKKAYTSTELLMKVSEVDSALLKKIDRTNQDIFFKENLTIYNTNNKEIYTSNDEVNYKITDEILQKIRKKGKLKFSEGTHRIIGVLYPDSSNQVITIIGAEDYWGNQNINSLRNTLLFLYLIIIILVAVIGWYFSGKALAPISRVVSQVKSIFPNHLEQSLTVENPKDEIGKLTLTFNDLLERVNEAFRLQKLFISNVSHELKNPLMRMGTQLDVAMLKERTVDEYKSLAVSLREDIRELSQLSQTLLELAKVNDEIQGVVYGQIRIDEIIWETRLLLMSAESSYLVTVDFNQEINTESQLTINGNAQLLKTAFVNLMENGCKFSEDEHVNIRVSFSNESIKIDFQNTGEFISDDETKLIFQPFYRKNNTTNIKGYGVGLALVERIIKLHGGVLSVHSYVSTQTNVFSITLPY